MTAENVAIREVQVVFSVDMQFIGQSHVRCGCRLKAARPNATDLQAGFEAAYWERFQVELDEIRAKVVNLNCSVIGVADPVDLTALIDPGDAPHDA